MLRIPPHSDPLPFVRGIETVGAHGCAPLHLFHASVAIQSVLIVIQSVLIAIQSVLIGDQQVQTTLTRYNGVAA